MTKHLVTKSIFIISLLLLIFQSIYPQLIGYIGLMPRDIINNPNKYFITLFTHMFIHTGWIHLAINTLFIYFFGTMLEERIGGIKYGLVFLLSGIATGLGFTIISLLLNVNFGGVGTSGALFGVFGALTIMYAELNVYIFFTKFKITYALFILILINAIYPSLTNMAHIVGILSGTLIGYKLKYNNNNIKEEQYGNV